MTSHEHDRPALLGGPPIRSGGPPGWPVAGAGVRAALEHAVASGAWGQYHGPNVPAFEGELAAFHQVPFALTCATGTLGVETALRVLQVGPGDEVLLAAYDYESNFLTVHALGAKPVLVEVAAGNWNLDVAVLEAAITPASKAVIVSHLHGGLVPMREVLELAGRHKIAVVEDAAQACGARVQGRPAGAWGDVGTLSFGGSKLLSAGRGGALLFRDARLHQRAKLWLTRGLQQWAPLSELQAAVLRPQLAGLPEAHAHRVASVARIAAGIARAGVPGLTPFVNATTESGAAYYKFGFRFEAEAFGLPRDVFVKALRAEGIAFDAGFNALHLNRSPSRFRAPGPLHEAARAHEGCVVLHHPVLLGSAEETDQVASAVTKVYRNRERLRGAV